MKSPKRLTKVTITAEIFVEDIRPDRAGKKLEKSFWEKVICKPYVKFASYKVGTEELDTDTGEPTYGTE